MNNKGHVLLVVIITLVIIGVLALSTWGFLQNKSKSNTIETSTTKLQETTLTPQEPVINTEDQQKTEITVEQTPETIIATKPQQQETPAEVNPPSNNQGPSIDAATIYSAGLAKLDPQEYGKFTIVDGKSNASKGWSKDQYTYVFVAKVNDSDGWIQKVQFILNDKVIREAYPNGVSYTSQDKWSGSDLSKAYDGGEAFVRNKYDDDDINPGLYYHRNEKYTAGYDSCKYREGLRMIYTGDDKLYDIMAKDPENFAVCASGDSINFHDYYLGIKKRLDKGSYVYKVKAFDNNGAETEKTIFEFSVN